MTLCRATVCAAACAMVMLVMPRGVMAQASAPHKPQAADPNTAIDAYLSYEIARLNSDNLDDQTKARDEIIAAATPSKAGAEYFGLFDTVLNTQLYSLETASSSSFRAKINAGIICERVALATDGSSDELEQADHQLLADPAPAVAAHGLKAAGTILAAMLSNPVPPPVNSLAGAIIKAVKIDTPASMVDDAWNALTLNNQVVPAEAPLQMATFVRQFLNERRDQYVTGTPNNQYADSYGILLLCSTFGQQSKADQTASMQAISDLISVAGQRANARNATDLTNTAKMLDKVNKAMASTKDIANGALLANPLQDMQMKVDKKAILDATKQVSADLCKGSAQWAPLNPPPLIVDKPPA